MAGPAPSAITDAGALIDQQKAAALAALAHGGTAGLAAYQAAQQAGQADKMAAVNAQLSAATQLNAPAGAGAELQGIVARPFDQYAATTGSLNDAFRSASDTRQQGANTYFSEASAAVPIIRALAEKQVANIKARADAAAAAKATADAKAAAGSRGFAGTGVSESEVRAAAIGKAQSDLNAAQQQANALQSQLPSLETDIRNSAYSLGTSDTAVGNREASGAALDLGTSTDPRLVALHNQITAAQQKAAQAAAALRDAQNMPDYQRNQQAAITLGVPHDTALGMFGPPTPAAQAAATAAAVKLANDPITADAERNAVIGLHQAPTRAAFVDSILRAYADHPEIARAVVAKYVPIYDYLHPPVTDATGNVTHPDATLPAGSGSTPVG